MRALSLAAAAAAASMPVLTMANDGHKAMLATVASKGYPAGYEALQPLTAGNFTNKVGFLAAGYDIMNGPYTFAQASNWCGNNDEVSAR